MSLRQKTARGSLYMGISRVGSMIISMLSLLWLARLLDPSDFGVVALGMVLFSTSRLFTGLGTSAAIVQSKLSTSQTAYPAFVINCIAGISFFVIAQMFMPNIAQFLGDSSLVQIMRWQAITILLSSLSLVPEALLRKNLRFGLLSRATIVGTGAQNAVAVALAFSGFGVWSLVWGDLVGSIVQLSMIWGAFDRPVWIRAIPWEWKTVRGLLRYGLPNTGSGIVDYVNSHWDDWLVGRYLGTTALGYYTKAYEVTNGMIVGLGISVLNGVLFPSYSLMQDDRARLERAYLKALSVSAIVMVPLSLGVLAVANEAVPVLLGDKWIPMIPVLQVFSYMALARPLAASTSPVFQAVGHPEYNLRAGIVVMLIMIPFALLWMQYGILGVAWAVVLSYLGGLIFNVAQMQKVFPGTVFRMFRAVVPATLAGMTMLLIVGQTRRVLTPRMDSDAWLLIILVVTGAAVYLAIGYMLQRAVYQDIVALVLASRRSKSLSTGRTSSESIV